ncbi:hypothetical protein LCGC14_2378080 [marine sediment metagenome]|uniref:Uncharacterized protein n=1 Tax=marine sediment metagenome TaxID=412755 RepID=A0A0F9CNZ7_9ZZZZ
METNNEQQIIPIQHKKPVPWQHIIYITSIFIIIFASIIINYSNPKIVEVEKIKEVEVIKEVEKIVEVEAECPFCNTSSTCPDCQYSQKYVLSLIAQAKKCERSEYHYDLDECTWKLNKTDEEFEECEEELDDCEDDCEDLCDEFEYNFDKCEDNLTDCKNDYNECSDDLNDCEDCLNDEDPEICYD